jgi:hypothetical protein
MVSILVFRVLSIVGMAFGAHAEPPEVMTSPRAAQVRLVEVLAEADAIEAIDARGRTITFTVSLGKRPVAITASTSRTHEVTALTIGHAVHAGDGLGLDWLRDELTSVTAITHLVPDGDGAIDLVTSDGRRYAVIPGRGSGGNAAVEARWAGTWDR